VSACIGAALRLPDGGERADVGAPPSERLEVALVIAVALLATDALLSIESRRARPAKLGELAAALILPCEDSRRERRVDSAASLRERSADAPGAPRMGVPARDAVGEGSSSMGTTCSCHSRWMMASLLATVSVRLCAANQL
jgi:hypothetical protein